MKFEKQMKKHIDQTLEENVPNPYPKRKPAFPNWLKVAIPTTTGLLAACIALAVVIPSIGLTRKSANKGQETSQQGGGQGGKADHSRPNSSTKNFDGVVQRDAAVAAPKHKGIDILNNSLVNRTALKSIEALDGYFQDSENQNFVLSPATYLLASSALIAASDGFTLDNFGLTNAKEETKTLLEYWNSYWINENNDLSVRMDSGVLHQQVGPKYEFDDEKVKDIEDAYIATSRASNDNYLKQAEDYFKENVGLTIPIPPIDFPDGNGVVTYGALKLVDNAVDAFVSEQNDFYINGNKTLVNTAVIGTKELPYEDANYYENEQYQMFAFGIGRTGLAIVLPKEGVALESISISEAYSNFRSKEARARRLYGYVPFFHVKTEAFNFTSAFASRMNGTERLYSKILKNPDALRADDPGFYLSAKQTSDFEFTDKGVFGESIAAIGAATSAIPPATEPIEVNVNRPFYAISLEDYFPLFVNKVNDPTK